MDRQAIAAMARGGFETTGTATTLVGTIPVVGNVASVIGLVAEVGEKGNGVGLNGDTYSEYLLGP